VLVVLGTSKSQQMTQEAHGLCKFGRRLGFVSTSASLKYGVRGSELKLDKKFQFSSLFSWGELGKPSVLGGRLLKSKAAIAHCCFAGRARVGVLK